ncbi:MAG: hypothetical protein K0B87_04335 [Candidatus Syntrophosphaera sp.]|nr:hypothetical protein [Candidatus Syntrophosphaera sp.]
MHKYLLSILLALALLMPGCDKWKKDSSQLTPLAEVNGEVLYQEQFRSTFSDEQWERLSPEQKKQEIEDWVNVTLLAQEAEEQNLAEELAVRQRIDYATKKIKANALISKRLANINIGEEEMFNYYRLHRNDFQSKLMEYEVQRILCPDPATPEILLRRIREGYNFNTAVLEQSQEGLKQNLGRMGFVTAAGEDSLFWRAAHELKQNEPGIANIAGMTYILRHTNQREGNQDANFSEYRNEIRAILLRDKQKQAYEDLVRELKIRTSAIYYY